MKKATYYRIASFKQNDCLVTDGGRRINIVEAYCPHKHRTIDAAVKCRKHLLAPDEMGGVALPCAMSAVIVDENDAIQMDESNMDMWPL
jgi:hypothetical protein